MTRLRWAPAATAALVAIATTAAVATASSETRGQRATRGMAPARDTFNGRITGATGTYHGDRGTVTIVIAAASATSTARHVTLTLHGHPCAGGSGCVQLGGKLSGTLKLAPRQIADIGAMFRLSTSGTVTPLGASTTRGTVHGTGFIARGHESMALTISAAGGKVKVQAQSPFVPGFTSP